MLLQHCCWCGRGSDLTPSKYRVDCKTAYLSIYLYTILTQALKKSEAVFTKMCTEFIRIMIQMQFYTVVKNFFLISSILSYPRNVICNSLVDCWCYFCDKCLLCDEMSVILLLLCGWRLHKTICSGN